MFEFNVVSGKVVLADPCYARVDVECGLFDIPAVNGKWLVDVIKNENGDIESFQCSCSEFGINFCTREPFEFGVDAGIFGIFDSSIWEDESDWVEGGASFYSRCCDAVHNPSNDDAATVDSLGFLSVSGYGDGSYMGTLWKDTEGRLTQFHIQFLKNYIGEGGLWGWEDEE